MKPVPVYFTDPLPSACLVGVFRPYIALPLTAKPQEAIQVLTHEVCHIKTMIPCGMCLGCSAAPFIGSIPWCGSPRP